MEVQIDETKIQIDKEIEIKDKEVELTLIITRSINQAVIDKDVPCLADGIILLAVHVSISIIFVVSVAIFMALCTDVRFRNNCNEISIMSELLLGLEPIMLLEPDMLMLAVVIFQTTFEVQRIPTVRYMNLVREVVRLNFTDHVDSVIVINPKTYGDFLTISDKEKGIVYLRSVHL